MKRKRRALSFLLACLILCSIHIVPQRAEAYSGNAGLITPAYINIIRIAASLDISANGYASCGGSLYFSGASGKVICTLQRYQNGAWTAVNGWNNRSGSPCLVSGGQTVTRGYSYRVRVNVFVYNTSGILIETDEVCTPAKWY